MNLQERIDFFKETKDFVISDYVYNMAKHLAIYLENLNFAIVPFEGGIQFEKEDHGWYLEIEITDLGCKGYLENMRA